VQGISEEKVSPNYLSGLLFTQILKKLTGLKNIIGLKRTSRSLS